MTVKELISLLKAYNPDLDVEFYTSEQDSKSTGPFTADRLILKNYVMSDGNINQCLLLSYCGDKEE